MQGRQIYFLIIGSILIYPFLSKAQDKVPTPAEVSKFIEKADEADQAGLGEILQKLDKLAGCNPEEVVTEGQIDAIAASIVGASVAGTSTYQMLTARVFIAKADPTKSLHHAQILKLTPAVFWKDYQSNTYLFKPALRRGILGIAIGGVVLLAATSYAVSEEVEQDNSLAYYNGIFKKDWKSIQDPQKLQAIGLMILTAKGVDSTGQYSDAAERIEELNDSLEELSQNIHCTNP